MAKRVPSRIASFFIGYAVCAVLWAIGIPLLTVTPLFSGPGLLAVTAMPVGIGVLIAVSVRAPARRLATQLAREYPAELLISVVLDPQSVEHVS